MESSKNVPESKFTTHFNYDIDANEHCPGVGSEKAGKSDSCAGCPNQKVCASGEAQKEDPALDEIS
jgi:hypothetical protein